MSFLEGILYVIWRGLAIGIIISAPMGPVGILCVQRTLEKGRLTGFFTGVGAAISDLFYCILTGFGLSFIEEFLKANQTVIQIFGSIVLILFGVYLFRSHPARQIKKPDAEQASKGKNVLGGFLFTVSNPLIIFLIIGLFARFDFFLPEISFGLYVIGYIFIAVGALLWWGIVSFFVDKVRAHFNLRSMWLINKITGGIIMIFAIVGIITAFTSNAEARTREALYLNSARGFGDISGEKRADGKLLIENRTNEKIYRFLPLNGNTKAVFKLRVANINNKPGKSYAYIDSDSAVRKVSHPAWGIALKSGETPGHIEFRTPETQMDELYPACLEVRHDLSAENEVKFLRDNADFFTGENSISAVLDNGMLTLSCGNRNYAPVFEKAPVKFSPDSIGIFINPGGAVTIDCISLVCDNDFDDKDPKWAHLASEDARHSYFSRSSDKLEGEWQMFDRMLEEDLLRPAGDYRLACVKRDGGYDLVYLDGAVRNGGFWRPGMTKASLETTPFDGIFDVTWRDPSGKAIEAEIKAQYDEQGILNFQFPDHAMSTMRMRKVKY